MALPIAPKTSVNVPPFWIVSMPATFWPTVRFWAVAPAAPTTVAFGVTVLIIASLAAVGTPALQLPGVNQLEELVPVQLVCALVDTTDAASNTSAAKKTDK